MRLFRSLAKGALLLSSAVAMTLALTMPANADPNHPVNPTDITCIGGDIPFLLDNLGEGPGLWNAQHPNQLLDCWNPVNPLTGAAGDPIMIKPGVTITRPNGCNAGISELINDPNVDVVGCARGPQTGDSTTAGPLLFVPFATDVLQYASSKQAPTVVPDGLSAAQLTSIYNCSITNWNQLGGPDAPIHPLIPQLGSGERSVFLQQLGLATTGPCTTVVEQDDPAPIQNDPGAIAPWWASRFVFPTDLSSQIQLNNAGSTLLGWSPS
jgi:hypothetical protein